MSLKKLLITIAIVLSAISAAAQEYHGRIIYDVVGPVKKVKISGGDYYAKYPGSASFIENGQIKNDMMTYNADGYPFGYQMTFNSKLWKVNISYNDENRPSEYTEVSNFPGVKMDIKVVYTYSDGKIVREDVSDRDKRYIFEYSGWEYDSHGNWIKRTVHQTYQKNSETPAKESTFTQTRKITYFQ